MALTKRQKEVLDFIADFVVDNGYSPSYDELAQALQLASLATVHKHIGALESRHYLSRGFNQSRSLQVAPQYLEQRRRDRSPQPSGAVPLLGRIAAGSPVEAFASDAKLQFTDFTGAGGAYALEVRGDSMIEDHICSGDFVLVEPGPTAKNGDIVVALVGGTETTLKRYFAEADGRVRLQPANPAMQPIFVEPDALQIQGRVLAVLRKYR